MFVRFGHAPSVHDNLSNVPLDIQPAFYPAPCILVPDINIPTVEAYQYEFKLEKCTLEKYKIHELQLTSIENVDMPINNPSAVSPNVEVYPDSTYSPVRQSVEVEKSDLDYSIMPSSSNLKNLDSTAAEYQHENVKNPDFSANQPSLKYKKLIEFGEFESKGTVFDIVELNSLDDRRELETILSRPSINNELPGPAPMSTWFPFRNYGWNSVSVDLISLKHSDGHVNFGPNTDVGLWWCSGVQADASKMAASNDILSEFGKSYVT